MMPPDTTKVTLLTFNCAKCRQSSSEWYRQIRVLLGDEGSQTNTVKGPPDIVAIALEEVAPIIDSCFESVDSYLDPVRDGIQRGFADHQGRGQYELAQQHSQGALSIFVWVNTETNQVKTVFTASARCGYALSNMKGAVGVRLLIQSKQVPIISEWTFVGAHLSAYEGPEMLARRNDNFQTLAGLLDFGDGYGLYKPNTHTFFMGDLNYRATLGTVSPTIENFDIATSDELTSVLRAGNVFTDFVEAPIKFPPTYKYHINESPTDTQRIYNYQNRTPSWCDRILYHSYRGKESVISYTTSPLMPCSDHLPVILQLKVPTIIEERLRIMSEDSAGSLLSEVADYSLNPYRVVYSYIGRFSDRSIGWGLYLSTTNSGRVWLGLLIVIVWFLLM